MVTLSSLESAARELIDLELQRIALRSASTREPPLTDEVDVNFVAWLLPDLLALVAEKHERHVRHLAPAIRQMICDRTFLDECGDCAVSIDNEQLVNRHVQLIVAVLEKVRLIALAQGDWSNAPVTPQMCG